MNNFGLGLILSFTDNATSGLRGATSAFNELSNSVTAFSSANGAEAALLQVSAAAGIVGNELYSVGRNITALFTNVISSITETGTSIASARAQLSTLYGDAASGQHVLDQIKEYSAKSIFNFEDLIPSVIMLKANGIEAFDEIATSAYRASNGVEGTAQTLMDYAADLAAFNPSMHNMYGTGVQAAMGALNEYIAEGNAASLKRGASLDILQILGEEKGSTIEERSRQVADLIEKLGMVGMTANLAGTPMQRLSNVSDVFFNLMTEISDSGVFEKYSSLIEKFTEYLFSIPSEELTDMAHVIADALVELMDPLETVIDLGIEVVDWLRDLFKQNPEMTKMIVKGTALAGVFLLMTGAGLKLLSALGTLKFSLSMLFSGSSILTTGARILGLLKNFALYILPIVAAVALLKAAWDRDFLGMQERVKTFVKETWDTLKILFEAFNDYTLSEESFERAKELGILPLIESVLQLKYHFDFLVEGLKNGFNAFFDTLGEVLTRMGILDEETHGFRDLVTKLFEKMTAPGMTDTWEKIGYFIGESVGWLLLVAAVLPVVVKSLKIIVGLVKTIFTVVGVLKTVLSWIPKLFGFIAQIGPFISNIIFYIQYGWYIFTSSVLPAITGALSTIGGFITNIVTLALTGIGNIVIAILSAVGIVVSIPAWLVGLIVIAVAAIAALIWHFRDEIAAFFVSIGNKIAEFFSSLWEWLMNTPIAPVISAIIGLIQSIFFNVIALFSSVIQAIKPIIQTIGNLIKTVASSVWQVIKSIASLIGNVFYAIYEIVRTIVLSIIWVFKQLWDSIAEGLNAISTLFDVAFTWVYNNVISPAVAAISIAFDWLYTNVFQPIGESIKAVFRGVAVVIRWLKESVVEPVFTGIKTFICNAVQAVSDFVMPIINAISDSISWVANGLSSVVDAAGGFFGNVGDFFKGVGDGISEMIGLSTGGYVKTKGIAVLHPNEVVVNDKLTKGLDSFLSDYEVAKTTSSPLVTQDIIATDDYEERDTDIPILPTPPTDIPDNDDSDNNSPMQSFVNNSTTNNNNTTNDNSEGDTNNDNSVTFEQGSIVFNIDKDTDLANMSEEELNAVAEKLMKIMARKLQLREMQTRK